MSGELDGVCSPGSKLNPEQQPTLAGVGIEGKSWDFSTSYSQSWVLSFWFPSLDSEM